MNYVTCCTYAVTTTLGYKNSTFLRETVAPIPHVNTHTVQYCRLYKLLCDMIRYMYTTLM